MSSIPLAGPSFEPLIVSQDLHWLLGIHSETNCALYDLRTARPVHDFADFRLYGDCAAFSPDGRWLACATTNNDIRIWDLGANREKTVFKGHKWWVYALRFSPDGTLLASGGYDAQVWLWSLKTGKALYPAMKGHRSGVIPVVFSADGKTLITGSADRTIRWWSVATGKEMLLFEDADIISRNAISQAELNPGGNLLVWHEREGASGSFGCPSLRRSMPRKRRTIDITSPLMTRAGQSVQVTDNGEPLWILQPAAGTDADEADRRRAIDLILEESLREKPSNISADRGNEEMVPLARPRLARISSDLYPCQSV